jgi:hypothetical protein
MLQAPMTKKKIEPRLPRNKPAPHDFHVTPIRFPTPLWNRMINAGLKWGDVTQFVLQAVKEKLDREHPESTSGK